MAEKGTAREKYKAQEAGVKYSKTLTADQKVQVSIANQLKKIYGDINDRVKEQSSFLSGITGELRLQKEIEDLREKVLDESNANIKEDQKTLQDLTKQLDIAKATTDSFGKIFPNIGASMAQMEQSAIAFGNVLMGPLGWLALLAGAVTILMKMVKQANEIRGQFGVTLREARKLNFELKRASIRGKAFGLSAEQVRESFDAIAVKFGDISQASVDLSVELARVARNTGLGVDKTTELVSLFSAANNESRQAALNSIELVSQLASMEGVAPGAVMSELAEQADLFASFINRGQENLIKAAAAAKKVGMEFGGLVQLGDGLLDITERINKEQVLSTILGKQVSLQRFTILNAQGKINEAQEELASQLKGINQLSAQQLRFFSESLGVATSDLVRLTGLSTGGVQSQSSQIMDTNTRGIIAAVNEVTAAIGKEGKRRLI
jgi:hypothetical protein